VAGRTAQRQHLICLTLDTDPDGLNGRRPDRKALSFQGLETIRGLLHPFNLITSALGMDVPMTWFLRVDGQLRQAFGDALHLVRKFEAFWQGVQNAGDELAWHPHLYDLSRGDGTLDILTDPVRLEEELQLLWNQLQGSFFVPTAFRNGEGWHTKASLSIVKHLGITVDSTAIPGRKGSGSHPLDWIGTPNQPYFPDDEDIRRPGGKGSLLEMPISTWRLQAPYDDVPKIRYMNPAVHEGLFTAAVSGWRESWRNSADGSFFIWTMVFHPDDVLPEAGRDLLYARSWETVARNVKTVADAIRDLGDDVTFGTVSMAADRWRAYAGAQR